MILFEEKAACGTLRYDFENLAVYQVPAFSILNVTVSFLAVEKAMSASN